MAAAASATLPVFLKRSLVFREVSDSETLAVPAFPPDNVFDGPDLSFFLIATVFC